PRIAARAQIQRDLANERPRSAPIKRRAVHRREKREEVRVIERRVEDDLVALVMSIERMHHAAQRALEPAHILRIAVPRQDADVARLRVVPAPMDLAVPQPLLAGYVPPKRNQDVLLGYRHVVNDAHVWHLRTDLALHLARSVHEV